MDDDESRTWHDAAHRVVAMQTAKLRDAARLKEDDPRVRALANVARSCGSDTIDALAQLLREISPRQLPLTPASAEERPYDGQC